LIVQVLEEALHGPLIGKQKATAYDLATNVEIIRAVEAGREMKSAIARHFNLRRSNPVCVIKSKEKYKHLLSAILADAWNRTP